VNKNFDHSTARVRLSKNSHPWSSMASPFSPKTPALAVS
jgi:hypothetical protein